MATSDAASGKRVMRRVAANASFPDHPSAGQNMKGYVPTPDAIVDRMVAKLFEDGPPCAGAKLLDPGAGRGAFVAGVLRWCADRGVEVPEITAVESDPAHAGFLRRLYAGNSRIVVLEQDFLTEPLDDFDYIIGNPPYVAITGLSEQERTSYRRMYSTARGRFDLYMLFFERSLRLLRAGGRLAFITPEKFLYVEAAGPLRELLSAAGVRELVFLDEATFPGLITYPLITVIAPDNANGMVAVTSRDGTRSMLRWSGTRNSWMQLLNPSDLQSDLPTLGDVCRRISCGVATGADSVFVVPVGELEDSLRPFAHRTIAGREIIGGQLPRQRSWMLAPYDRMGRLLPELDLGPLGDYLAEPTRKEKLLARTCVSRKPWYAFHETPPLGELIVPKILCKDIGIAPTFVVDRIGDIVPRHSVYYLIPRRAELLAPLAEYLSSATARRWLEQNGQRAANGFLRMQSHVLKSLPVPVDFAVTDAGLSFDQPDEIRRSA